MSLNFIILLLEFFYFKRGRLFFYFSLIVFLFSLISYLSNDLSFNEIKNSVSNSLNLLGILLGFVSAVFTVVITISTTEVEMAKNQEIKGFFNKKKSYLYDEIISSFMFLIILLGLLLIVNFIFPFLINYFESNYIYIFSLISSLIIFAVLKLISTIFDFYFIISSSKNRPMSSK